MSFLLEREEEEHEISKSLKQAESPCVLYNEYTFAFTWSKTCPYLARPTFTEWFVMKNTNFICTVLPTSVCQTGLNTLVIKALSYSLGSLVSRLLCGGRGKWAWYTLFAHVPSSLGNLHILLHYTKIMVNFCLLAERLYCRVILPVGYICVVLKSETMLPWR